MNMKPNVSTGDKNMATIEKPTPKKVSQDHSEKILSIHPQVSNGCRIFLLFYYAFVTLVLFGLILLGHVAWLKEHHHPENNSDDNHNFTPMYTSFSFTKVKPAPETYHSGEEVWNSSIIRNKLVYAMIGFKIQSNPYNLDIDQIAQQFMSAKVSSLKKRIKRFACWHSCFGQFRKKAIRTLYGSSIRLYTPSKVSSSKQTQPAVENDDGVENENKIKKRQTDPSGAESENNELGEGKNTASSKVAEQTQDVNSKFENTTTPFVSKNKVTTEKSTALKAPTGEVTTQSKREYSESEEEVELGPAEEEEDSESSEETDEGDASISESEESAQDKEDGKDRKDQSG